MLESQIRSQNQLSLYICTYANVKKFSYKPNFLPLTLNRCGPADGCGEAGKEIGLQHGQQELSQRVAGSGPGGGGGKRAGCSRREGTLGHPAEHPLGGQVAHDPTEQN